MADIMSTPQALELHIELSSPDSPSEDDNMQTSSVNGSAAAANANNSRRPPRKSTLTQQQKNQKRQRATQEQLMLLEVEFNKNPTPTALVRERIAQEIDMTERSVQIWFQNRRAKIKNIAKRSIESGEDCDSIPESMRQYLAMQAYGPGGKGLAASMLGRVGSGYGQYGAGTLMLNTDNATSKVVIQHFACRSLSVGTWRRVGQSTMDLVIFYSPDKACVTYYINNENVGYKIEYPFAWIKNISLEQGDVLSAAEGASQRSGGLVIELTRPPKFYMDSSGQGGFYECGDFTEDQQATQIMVHHLGGPSKVLSGQLAKLVSLESYQNRHMNMFDPTQFAVSAPVSPMRPASQPNHMLHPHHPPQMSMYQQEAIGLMGPPAPRGHKRQRSRSVPAAIDMSMLRHPMPSFLIQHEQPSAQPLMQDPNIFAPIPQHHAPPQFAPGPGLSIDTSAAYGMGMPFNGPMSATTANSPSEFGTPGFFTSAPPPDAMHAAQFGTPYNNGFLQVDAGAMLGTSNTPLSITSHGDPIIADHSPPLSGLGRSASADIFSTPGEHSQFGDEGLYLSETFNKQIQLPFRSPMSEHTFQSPLHHGSFDFQSPPGTSQSHVRNPFDGSMPQTFDMPPQQTQDGSMIFHSTPTHNPHVPQNHQDSGISFSTPSQMSRDHSKDGGLLYQDSKVYTSPGQMHQLPDEQSMYQNSPLAHQTSTGDEFLYIDPNHLG
ncbi:hypothetical protein LTR78_000529 [Recurvomyces mirabilis]|uniref:Homeobox domain-containing protein n=1 Tax=Recurvomyces mirabilis TaxID=574656 RepID=A0AAE0WXW8_9PEZI|nr:hypothetical protein LTR78_000529 [Recurvomyces mirabilis]KAK5162183.1 hypothetical protein LTS14_000529 [Recurvomyces mirabilis]